MQTLQVDDPVRALGGASRYRVLFLCRTNAARSIVAEALLNALGADRFAAYSAALAPAGRVDARALRVLMECEVPIGGLRSKSWQEFATSTAPRIDLVVSLCRDLTPQRWPDLPGRPVRAHWHMPDPEVVRGSAQWDAMRDTVRRARHRLDILLSTPHDVLCRMA